MGMPTTVGYLVGITAGLAKCAPNNIISARLRHFGPPAGCGSAGSDHLRRPPDVGATAASYLNDFSDVHLQTQLRPAKL